MDGTRSVTETYDLIIGLLSHDGSFLRAAYFGIERLSAESRIMAKVFNGIIATSDAKSHAKKQAMIKFKTPRQFDENGNPIKTVVITLEEKKIKFAHVQVAKKEEALNGNQ